MSALLDTVLLPRVADEAHRDTQDLQGSEILHALLGKDARVFLTVHDQGRRLYSRNIANR